jgi:drug/metabolite transporter (DMT)-like permease
VTPNAYEFLILTMVGFLGISGQALITHGLSQGEATVLVPLDYSRILYSAVIGYLLFNEVPGPWSFAGMALIIAASLYLVLTEKKRKAAVVPAQPE